MLTTCVAPQYTGKERDSETNLDYFGARYMSSAQGRFTSPDSGADQHPEDPQSWNLYSYARNSPLVLVDPTGEYVCGSSMSDEQCQKFQQGLDKAQRAIDAYGKAGVDNGVTIQVGDTGKYGALVTAAGAIGPKTADNPAGQKIEAKFSAGSLGNAMDESHEGSHVADGSAWVPSGFSAAMNPTRFDTEMMAYHVSAAISECRGNIFSTVSFASNTYLLAVRRWNPSNTDTAIKNTLKREYNLLPDSKIKAFQRNTRGARKTNVGGH